MTGTYKYVIYRDPHAPKDKPWFAVWGHVTRDGTVLSVRMLEPGYHYPTWASATAAAQHDWEWRRDRWRQLERFVTGRT